MTAIFYGGAYVFQAGMDINGDGCPTCYGPPGYPTLDYLANAGRPGDFYGLVCDPSGAPMVQGSADPAPGYYISTTALVDHSKAAADPHRYVNSAEVPYITVPPELRNLGVLLGDVAWVLYGDCQAGAVVADVGPHGHYGEGSIELARVLRIPSSPKHGGVDSGVIYIVFPKSAQGWPRDVGSFVAQAAGLFSAWGGMTRIRQLFAPRVA